MEKKKGEEFLPQRRVEPTVFLRAFLHYHNEELGTTKAHKGKKEDRPRTRKIRPITKN
jgi:hypothetical protein